MTGSAESVLARIVRHAEDDPGRIAWRQVFPDGSTCAFSRGDLIQRAAGVAEALQAFKVGAGEIVALLMPHSESLAIAWLGTLMRGAIPTILAEPSVRMKASEYGKMLAHLFGYLSPAAAVVCGDGCREVVRQAASGSTTRIVDMSVVPSSAELSLHGSKLMDTVALQHSSGTTGQHKGVMMTNGQMLSQVRSYAEALRLDAASDRIASWLPLYHDMGFIACLVMPLLYGIETVQMSPFDWIVRPWMLPVAVSNTRATLSWLPNFAYHVLATRCTAQHLEGVDVSSWRQIVNCSEPCTISAFERFLDRFSPYGLSRKSLGVSYASAETTFAVTEGGVRRSLVMRRVDSNAYHTESKLVDCADGMSLVGCGTPVSGAQVEVRNDRLERVPADTIGEIWVKAPFLMQGYFRRPELDAQVIQEGWYRTGDLGATGADGELYVTGRLKDLIIIGGINVPPQDVEEIASDVPGVIAGRVVAIGVWDNRLETQKLVVLVESNMEASDERNRIGLAIRSAVGARAQVQVSDVRVFPRGTLRKSTSGKLSRMANLRLYEEGVSENEVWAETRHRSDIQPSTTK